MKKWIGVVIAVLGVAGVTFASSIKVWSTGETLTSALLNSNFAHIHNTMVGGHGARLVNADVSGTAAIAHTKLATPALVPKAYAAILAGACGSSPCTVDSSSRVTSITWGGTGIYAVNLSSPMSGAYGGIIVTPFGTASRLCKPVISTSSIIAVTCFSDFAATTPADAMFSIVVFSN